MKHSEINTQNFKRKSANNNGFSFPESSGSTNPEYYLTSTTCNDQELNYNIQKNANFYCICTDWIEFVCKTNQSIELTFQNNQNTHITIEKKSVCNNPNFLNLHRIYFNGIEVFDIFSKPNYSFYKKDEVLIKVHNALLYSSRYFNDVLKLLEVFELNYIRLSRIDIALDGTDIIRLVDILNKFDDSHTIQINNDAISILPTKLNKKELRYPSWTIGKGKSGISANIYNKSDEIKSSGKNYITDYWKTNNIDTENVGRFEIKLKGKRLEKYNLNLMDLEQLSNPEFIGSMFTNEVKPWVKFYRIRKKDYLNHKKEVAIKKGREIRFIKWNKIPITMKSLKTFDYVPTNSVVNARNTISFNLHEILVHPNTSTTAQINIIRKYAVDYGLVDFTKNKIINLFENNNANPYKKRLDELDFK